MMSVTRFAHSLDLCGAKSPDLDARMKGYTAASEIEPEYNHHAAVETALLEHLDDGPALRKELAKIADKLQAARTLHEVQSVASAQSDGVLTAWIYQHADELVAAASKALQPELDRVMTVCATLPKRIRRDVFPVDSSWTPEQHRAWVEITDALARLDEIAAGLAGLYANIEGRGASWFAWIDPVGAPAGLTEAIDGTYSASGTFSETQHEIYRWPAIAHLAATGALKVKLTGPTEAAARAAAWIDAQRPRKVAR